MIEILSTLHDMEGAPKNDIENIAKGMFEKMDMDLDSELTLEQFTGAVLYIEEIVCLLRGQEDQ